MSNLFNKQIEKAKPYTNSSDAVENNMESYPRDALLTSVPHSVAARGS
jgi:hypothetical protein